MRRADASGPLLQPTTRTDFLWGETEGYFGVEVRICGRQFAATSPLLASDIECAALTLIFDDGFWDVATID